MSQINRENERNNAGTSSSSKRTDVWKPLGACSSLLRTVKQTDSCGCPQSLVCTCVKAERHRSRERSSREKAKALHRTGRAPGRNRTAKAGLGWEARDILWYC